MTDEEFVALDSRGSKVCYAHELTFPEMLESKRPVVNLQGVMIGGPDRKMIDEWTKWTQWQKAIQVASHNAGVVSKTAMAYFQKTKHLSRPPKSGDLSILQSGPIEDALIIQDVQGDLVAKQKPRFTWSHTMLDQFLKNCPAQAAAERYYKTVKFQETEATKWGNRVHKAGENYLLNPTAENAKILDSEEPRARKFDDIILNTAAKDGGTLLVEKKLCVNDKWKVTGYFDSDAWGRGAADIALIRGETCNIYDRKTGKKKDDPNQLKRMILFMALHYPEIQEFKAANIWYKEDSPIQSITPVRRSEVKEILLATIQDINRVKEMWDSETFVMRKSGLCRGWCSNKSCPHNGG